MLAVEIDGSAHDTQKKYDAGRDRWLLKACKPSDSRMKWFWEKRGYFESPGAPGFVFATGLTTL
jgi:very-short-patch-repair endonuclease